MTKIQGGFLGIGIGVIILLICAIFNPHYTGWNNLIYILFLLEGPWISIYNLILPIEEGIEPDFLSIGEGVLILLGPFLSIGLYYCIGYSSMILYQSLQKK